MDLLRGIVPFIVYAVLSSFVEWRTATLVATVLALVLVTVSLLLHHGLGVIDWCAVGLFGVCTVLGYAVPGLDLRHVVGPAGQLLLAAAVAILVAVGRPFTLPISRAQAPRRIWEHPAFIALNVRISTAWAIGLAASGVLMVGCLLLGVQTVWVQVLAVVLGVLGPLLYQRRAIQVFRARAQQQAATA